MANVFISYRKADYLKAEQLATEIRSAGHEVWLDEWKIDIGDSIIQKINEGLEGASYLVLCYSSHGVASPWIGREWTSTLARQLNGEQIKILPALLDGNPPSILSDLKYADLMTNWSKGVDEILKAIR